MTTSKLDEIRKKLAAVKALEPLLEWAIKNHEMPGYSEVIYNAREALERIK